MAGLRIVCIGGGPAGLYFALLMKKQNPANDVTIYERNQPDSTFGWGVVFSDETLQNFDADPESKREIEAALAHWDDIDVHFKGSRITSSGHGFSGIGRMKLLQILQDRCRALGVKLEFGREIDTAEAFADADLVIAADGLNSKIRNAYADHFRPQIDLRRNKFIWLGTHRLFEAFTFIFVETEHGWVQAHAYRFNEDTSTFIVEMPETTWRAAGLEEMSQQDGIAWCEALFAPWLDGNALMSNAKHLRGSAVWISFPRVACERWVKDNLVLMGDAAHTAHFSIGSGTKLAMEDAIDLAAMLDGATAGDIPAALTRYEEERKVEVIKIQSAARNSTEWFENVARYAGFEPEQFAYAVLTRSQRVSHENLRLRDRAYLEGLETWLAEKASGRRQQVPVPPMFAPFRLRDMELQNRVVVSPMATYSARDGLPNDFHMVHLGARATGGAGLVFTEMTCVSPQGRISPGCPGIWNDDQAEKWARIVDYVHQWTPAKICMQLGHSGPKGSTRVGWEGNDVPLDQGNWEIVAASRVRWSPANQIPRQAAREDMDEIRRLFVEASERADRAGFDMVELHCAHGYLLSSFISPLTNRRDDEYGGSLENRLRYPLEVFDAMRAVWPDRKPMSVRISATDWHPDGTTPDDAVEIARAFATHGVDLMDVSAGQTSIEGRPVYGRMFQTPFADRVRNEAGVATMAVGNIFEPDHANSIIASGRADLTALARPHLADPDWTQHAAARLHYDGQWWPPQYLTGRAQYLRNLERSADMAQQI